MWREVWVILRFFGLLINVIICLLGLLLLTIGVYEYLNVNIATTVQNSYRGKIPSQEEFVAMLTKETGSAGLEEQIPGQSMIESYLPGQSGSLTGNPVAKDYIQKEYEKVAKDIDNLIKTQGKKLNNINNKIVVGFITLGILLTFFAMLGIVVFTCAIRQWIFIVVYLSVLIPLFMGDVVIMILLTKEEAVQAMLFEIMDEIAYETAAANRFLMAGLQFSLKCCGVRGRVDYYCHGIYDYKCNPGCSTIDIFWTTMTSHGQAPLCAKVSEMDSMCALLRSKEECRRYLNVVMPINAKDFPICKNYTLNFNADGTARNLMDFRYYDKGKFNKPHSLFKVRGSPYTESDPNTRKLYKKGNIGCGYVVWKQWGVGKAFNFAFAFLIATTTSLAFLIAMCGASLALIAKAYNERRAEEMEVERIKKDLEEAEKQSQANNDGATLLA